MKASQMVESKFLKKEDLNAETGNLVTVVRFDQQNVGMNEGDDELKWIIYFKEFPKGMVLNSTNIQLATKALGSDETDEWIGRKLVIYVDDNVSFGGKLVGGIRIRRPRNQPQPDPTQATRNVTGKSGRTFEQEMDDGPAPW